VPDLLGLRPVGWIFSHDGDRDKDEDVPGTTGVSIRYLRGGRLLDTNMRNAGREDGSCFATLARDARRGVTEAFHLLDVAVQMVAEGMIVAA
jgi:hypothetical protein